LAQFVRFGVVGVLGFLVDTATVYAAKPVFGLYGAGALAYPVAASFNWALNRAWTFRGHGTGPRHHQWARFLAANAVGFVLNRGCYAILVTFSQVCADNPVLAVAAGAIAGLFTNFTLSRRLVFR
jgi:putative flippase GtrA